MQGSARYPNNHRHTARGLRQVVKRVLTEAQKIYWTERLRELEEQRDRFISGTGRPSDVMPGSTPDEFLDLVRTRIAELEKILRG